MILWQLIPSLCVRACVCVCVCARARARARLILELVMCFTGCDYTADKCLGMLYKDNDNDLILSTLQFVAYTALFWAGVFR